MPAKEVLQPGRAGVVAHGSDTDRGPVCARVRICVRMYICVYLRGIRVGREWQEQVMIAGQTA